MTISKDVLNIILSYVQSEDLPSFFLIHDISFNIKFKYDAQHTHLTFKKVDTFLNFTNVVLIGIYGPLPPSHNISLQNVLYLNIIKNIKSKRYNNIYNLVVMCPNVKIITFTNINFHTIMSKLNMRTHSIINSRTIIFNKCYNIWKWLNSSICKNLKVIKIINYNTMHTNLVFFAISQYSYLKQLIFENCCMMNSYMDNYSLNCKKLKILTF